MSRSRQKSCWNVSIMSCLQQLAEKTRESERHEYGRKPVVVRVVDVCRRFLFPVVPREFPELERLYRPFVVEGTLYLNFVIVCDAKYNCANLLLNPKFNKDMDQHKVKCGDVIKLTNYGCRVIPDLDMYFEICGFDLCQPGEVDGHWDSWTYDMQTSKDMAEAFEEIHLKCPISHSAPFRFWHESVPTWSMRLSMSPTEPDEATSAELLARFCSRAEIAHIDGNWMNVRQPFPPLVCRIRAKSNHEYYKPDGAAKKVPIKINLSVYDSTGGCSVVIWDQALSEEQASQLREGVVVMLRHYDVRRNMSDSKYRIDFGDLRRYPIELRVQDERTFKKKALEIIPREFLSHAECARHLPTVSQPCNTFPDILANRSTRHGTCLQFEEVFPVAGVVVGLSRYYRLRREKVPNKSLPIGRFYTSRWVEIYDPQSGLFLNVEAFINKQVESFTALEIGDVAAFTYVRLCKRKASNIKEDLTFVTTTQHTELIVMKKTETVIFAYPEIPVVIRREMRRIKIQVGDQHALEPLFWLGGAHQFVNTYYTNQAIHKLCTTDENVFADLPQFLKGLAFWESTDLMFSGQIVMVEMCTPEPTSVEQFFEGNGKISQTATVIAKADFWDALKENVPVYGSDCPHYLTLPMKFVERHRALLHEAVRFPKTNIYESESRRLLAENDGETMDEHFEVLSRAYYRIVVLRHDRNVAVSSFFLPMVAKVPATFVQTLHLSHSPVRKQLESPVSKNMEYSDFDIHECVQTAAAVLDKDVDVVLQARCTGFNDYEMLFCQLYFKKSEHECLY